MPKEVVVAYVKVRYWNLRSWYHITSA